jgi:micrococcal nuclease
MLSLKTRVALAVVVTLTLIGVLGGLYWYLKSIEPHLESAAQRLAPALEAPLVQLVSPSPLASDSAVVKRVIDGDTIELESGQTLRYIGIDTPETHHPTKGQECFGQEASQRNRELVEGKTIRLEKDVSEVDRYGRLLRYVWVDDQLINQQLVAEGYAVARSFPPDIAKQDIFRAVEGQARTQNLGLWANCPSL